jgi:transcriptional regulator with XRE-family HTH domain
MKKLKEIIEEKYGSINNFVHKNYTELGMSRTYIYKLLSGEECNPSLEIMIQLSKITSVPLEDIINEYSMRYRDSRVSSQHED